MKGIIIQHILKCLTEREKTTFLAKLTCLADGARLVKLCNYMFEPAVYSDAVAMRRCKMKRYQKDQALEQIGAALLSINGEESKPLAIAATYDFAKRVMFNAQYQASEAIVAMGIKLGEESEYYSTIIDFWNLVEDFPESPKLLGMSQGEAMRHLTDVFEFGNMLDRLKEVRHVQTVEERESQLNNIHEAAIARSVAHPLGKRARFLYLKVLSSCHILQSSHHLAIPCQEELVALVRDHPFVCNDPNHALAKEMRILTQLFELTRRAEDFGKSLDALNALPITTLHAQYEKIRQRFPFVIGLALDKGDAKGGLEACRQLLELLGDETLSLPPQFVTESLYCCAYFYLAAGQTKALPRIFAWLNRHAKSQFKPNYFLCSKFVRLIHKIELKDWEEATLQLRKLRDPKFEDELPGLKPALDFLEYIIKSKTSTAGKVDMDDLSNKIQELRLALQGLYFLDLFDLLAWVEAREEGCPMIEIFNHRAKPE